MKKTARIFLFLAFALLAPGRSCSSFLDVEQIGKNTIGAHFADVDGLASAGEGMHRLLLNFYDNRYIRYADIAGDMLNNNSASEGDLLLFNYKLQPSDNASYPYFVWSSGYEIVTAANNILYYGPKLYDAFPEQAKTIDKMRAWAFFCRAIGHFCLCNCYAQPYAYTPDASHLGVPVIDWVPGFDDSIPRSTVKEVYSLILSDLNKAISLFDGLGTANKIEDCYHVSGPACKALRARVKLYMQDWDGAAADAADLMSLLSLTPKAQYVDMFRNSQQVKGTESILRLNAYATTLGMRSLYDPTALYRFVPNPSVPGLYDPDDVRLQLYTYIPEDCEDAIYQGNTYPAVCKYLAWKSITDEKARVSDPFVLRLSEMYLIHAEGLAKGAAHDLAGAVSDIKALVARARGVAADAVSLPYTTQDDVEQLIIRERKRELGYEGHSLFDMIRCGRGLERPASCNAEVLSIAYPDHRFILPICQLEMTANDVMAQNDGYEDE